MRVSISGTTITGYDDTRVTGDTEVDFPGNPAAYPDFPHGYTVTGSAGSRVLNQPAFGNNAAQVVATEISVYSGPAQATQAALDAAETDDQPLDSDLTAIAALTTTAFGRGLLDDATAAAVRTTLGLGTAAVTDSTAYVPQATKRGYFLFGNGVDTSTSFTDVVCRRAFMVPVPGITRARFHIWTYDTRNNTARNFAITATGVWMGQHSLDSTGLGTGAFTATPTQVVSAFTTAADSSEYVSAWFTLPASCVPGVENLLSIGWTVPAASTVVRTGDRMWYRSAAGASLLAGNTATPTGGASASISPFEMWLEYEYVGAQKTFVAIGDSLTDGYAGGSTTQGVIRNWPNVASARNAQPAAVLAITGSQTSDWTTSTTARWTKLDAAAYVPDYVIMALGSNDMNAGTAAATIEANLVTIMGNVRTKWGNIPIYLGTIPPRIGMTYANDLIRKTVNDWIRLLPNGAAGYFDFDQAVRDSPARIVTDGATNTNTTVTSASALFTLADVGRAISGTGIPASTTIAAVASATSVTLSAAATATATGVTLTIGGGPSTPTPAITASDGTHFVNYAPMADAVRGVPLNAA